MSRSNNQRVSGTDAVIRMYGFEKNSYSPASMQSNALNFDVCDYSSMTAGAQHEYKYLAEELTFDGQVNHHQWKVPGSLVTGRRWSYLSGTLSLRKLVPIAHLSDSNFTERGNPRSDNLSMIALLLRRNNTSSASIVSTPYDGIYLWYIYAGFTIPGTNEARGIFGFWVIDKIAFQHSSEPNIVRMQFRSNAYIQISDRPPL